MAEKLTPEKLAFYKQHLVDRKKDLLKQTSLEDADINELRRDRSADPFDMAGNATSLELMATLGNNERRELAEIDHALGKIESGTYGICEVSGELIGEMRLEAIPTARYTMQVQQERERNPQIVRPPEASCDLGGRPAHERRRGLLTRSEMGTRRATPEGVALLVVRQ